MSNIFKEQFRVGFKNSTAESLGKQAGYNYSIWDVGNWKLNKWLSFIKDYDEDMKIYDLSYLIMAALLYPSKSSYLIPGYAPVPKWDLTDERIRSVIKLRNRDFDIYDYSHQLKDVYIIAWMTSAIKFMNSDGGGPLMRYGKYHLDNLRQKWAQYMANSKDVLEYLQKSPKYGQLFNSIDCLSGLMGNMTHESHGCPFRWQYDSSKDPITALDELRKPILNLLDNSNGRLFPKYYIGLGIIQWTDPRLYRLLFRKKKNWMCGFTLGEQIDTLFYELFRTKTGDPKKGKYFGPNQDIPHSPLPDYGINILMDAYLVWAQAAEEYHAKGKPFATEDSKIWALAWFDGIITGEKLDGTQTSRMQQAGLISKNFQFDKPAAEGTRVELKDHKNKEGEDLITSTLTPVDFIIQSNKS